ncbi:hypothetical protein AVEN_54771-1 [Araneus ventricosus]|uniref:Uncharacterized protein n=1 Tax=Araneus ventricosus TaxID=182803 RepID=A0A4Y2IWQ0_ARAVE|nr:hypothetical protein AVEN_54771-1 [Araneus ventricosus]
MSLLLLVLNHPYDSTEKASPPITNLPIPSSPCVAPVSEEALASPNFTDSKPNYVDTQLLSVAVLPPLEKQLLQSQESEADAEMSSSSSEEDALENDMSADFEESPAVISPPLFQTRKSKKNTKTDRRLSGVSMISGSTTDVMGRPMRKCPAVNTLKSVGSQDRGVNGLEFKIPSI